MNESIYAVLAYTLRYWFALLVLIIVWRAIQWIRKDASQSQRMRGRLLDAGFIGEWAVVLSQEEAMPEGMVLRASRDGWVGSGRACDIRVQSKAVPSRVARFYLRKDGLHMLPRHPNTIEVDGEWVRREAILRHGATLRTGGVTLQLRLFAGILLSGEEPIKKRARVRIEEAREDQARGDQAPAAAPVSRVELPKPALTVKIRRNRGKERGATWPQA